MKSFLNNPHPLVTTWMLLSTPEENIKEIQTTYEQGAEAFCVSVQKLPPQIRTEQNIAKIFAAAKDKPVYATCYRDYNVPDEQLAKEILLCNRLGATLSDVRTDMFDPQKGEFTADPTAVGKQRDLIKQLHDEGAEVIMSSHTWCFVPKDGVLKVLYNQQERGADIVKIVTFADDEKQLEACYEILLAIRKEIEKPALFLCGGKMGKRFRSVCPIIGNQPMILCATNQGEGVVQPSLAEGLAIAKLYREGL